NLRILDAASGREMVIIFAHGSPIADAVFTHDGNKIVSGSYDHTVRIWDATPLPADYEPPGCVTLRGHKELVSGVHFSPDGRWLASSSWDKTVKVWEASTEDLQPMRNPPLRFTLKGHGAHVSSVAFFSDKRTLATGSWDKTVKLWDLQAPIGESLTELRTIPCSERVISLAINQSGGMLAVGQFNGISFHDLANPTKAPRFERTPAPVPAVAFDPVSGRLASAGAARPAGQNWGTNLGTKPPPLPPYLNPNRSLGA